MSDPVDNFAALHVRGRPFLLVNAWDVMSALALADDGHVAIGTTSLGLTAAGGLPDGQRAGRESTSTLVRLLAGRLPVHLSVDAEDGYHDDPAAVADFISELAEYGAVGVNLEDGHRSGRDHANVVETVKNRVPGIFINARTDVFWSGSRDLPEALQRLRTYRDAGADGLFVPGLDEPASVARIVDIGPPVNVLWRPGINLAREGVARVSTGSALYRHALAGALDAAAAARDQRLPITAAIPYAAIQRLLLPPASPLK